MSDKLAVYDPFDAATAASSMELSKTLAASKLLPDALRGNPADVLVTIIAGKELGLGPMQAIRGIHIVQGKPVLSADLMVALVVARRDICEYFQVVKSDSECATYETKRVGAQPTTFSFTIAEAKVAGLTGKGTWKSYPAAMLRHRCAAALARAVYPDLVFGVYETSEGEEIRAQSVPATVSEAAEGATDAVVVDVDTMSAAIKDCETLQELGELTEDLAALPDADKADMRALYKARASEIRAAKTDAIREAGDADDMPK